jgi:hypothetical protein
MITFLSKNDNKFCCCENPQVVILVAYAKSVLNLQSHNQGKTDRPTEAAILRTAREREGESWGWGSKTKDAKGERLVLEWKAWKPRENTEQAFLNSALLTCRPHNCRVQYDHPQCLQTLLNSPWEAKSPVSTTTLERFSREALHQSLCKIS